VKSSREAEVVAASDGCSKVTLLYFLEIPTYSTKKKKDLNRRVNQESKARSLTPKPTRMALIRIEKRIPVKRRRQLPRKALCLRTFQSWIADQVDRRISASLKDYLLFTHQRTLVHT
jgi:hypothetical protein